MSVINKKDFIPDNSGYSLLAAILILMSVLAVCYFLSGLLIPFILAVLFTYILNPAVEYLERRGLSLILSMVIILLTLFILLGLIFFLVYKNLSFFLNNRFDLYYDRGKILYAKIIEVVASYDRSGQTVNWANNYKFYEFIRNSLIIFFNSTTNFLAQFVLFIVYLCFLLPGTRNFSVKTFRAFPRRKARQINQANEKIIQQIQQYLITKTRIALVSGFGFYLLCIVFKIELALVWGVTAFLLNFIPNFGPLIAVLFPAVFSFLQLSPLTAFIFLLLIIIWTIIVGYIIEPSWFSESLSLSPLVIFLSMIFWSWLWGLPGIFLSTPILSTINIIFQNIPGLKPIADYLRSSYPLKEDEEKLSVVYHLLSTDKYYSDQEFLFLEKELINNMCNAKNLYKTWNSVKKHPLPLEKIFLNKNTVEKLELYLLAVKTAALDKKILQKEISFLDKIQQYAGISRKVLKYCHLLITIELNEKISLKGIDLKNINTQDEDEQLASLYKQLGIKFCHIKQFNKAREYFKQALRLYCSIHDTAETGFCLEQLSCLEIIK